MTAVDNAALMAQATKNTQDGIALQTHLTEEGKKSTSFQSLKQAELDEHKAACKMLTSGPAEVKKIVEDTVH